MLAFTVLLLDPKAVSFNIKTQVSILLSRYSVVLAEYPYAVFFVTSLVIVICGLCSFVPQFNAPEIPDFSTPVMVRSYLFNNILISGDG